jgi:hypothetical protein
MPVPLIPVIILLDVFIPQLCAMIIMLVLMIPVTRLLDVFILTALQTAMIITTVLLILVIFQWDANILL